MLLDGENQKNTVPTLTLSPFSVEEEKPVQEKAPLVAEQPKLTAEEQAMVNSFATQIDLKNTAIVMQYGASAQKKMADFSEAALSNVKTKDLGEVGEMLSTLIVELKDFDGDEEETGFFGKLFKKSTGQLERMKTRFSSVEGNVNRIVGNLEGHQIRLMKDIAVLDEMYKKNEINFKELSMYILAGKKRLEEFRRVELAAAVEKAQLSNLPEDAQAANDLANLCDRFEKKVHDLELTRMVSLQMAPQIRMVQNNDSLMAEKIQSTINNTIPLWKSQMVLSLGLYHSAMAMEAQREVSDMTNALLKRNAEKLKMSTIETAKESERGIVDLETLQHTNRMLIDTLDEMMKIKDEGSAKRREAEQELVKIEGELKQKLLQMRK